MIIDNILDIKDGKKYNAKEFYYEVMQHYQVFPEIAEPIADALDGGENKDVRQALNNYIINNGYNTDICAFINSYEWL